MANIFHICSNCIYRLNQSRVGNIRRQQLHLYEMCAVFFPQIRIFERLIKFVLWQFYTCMWFILFTALTKLHTFIWSILFPPAYFTHVCNQFCLSPHFTHVYDPFSLPRHLMHVYNSLWLSPHTSWMYMIWSVYTPHITHVYDPLFLPVHTHFTQWSVQISYTLHTCLWSIFFTHTPYACI